MRLAVQLDSRIRFHTRPDLPVEFRRAVAEENTVANYPPAIKRGGPERVETYTHNPFTGEVTLRRTYWPRFRELAQQHGIHLDVADMREEQAILYQPMAIRIQDWRWAFESLAELLAPRLHAEWQHVHIQVTVTPWRRWPGEQTLESHQLQVDPDGTSGEVEPGGGPATPPARPKAPRRHHLRRGALPKVSLPGGADVPGGGS